MKRFLVLGAVGLIALTGCSTDGALSPLDSLTSLVAGETTTGDASTTESATRGIGRGFAQLSDEDRATLESIRAQVEAGEITREEAMTQIRSILGDRFGGEGFGRPHGFGGFGGLEGPLADLTDEQRAALEDIHARVESGELTREQAREEASKLGIELPLPPFLANLTDEQRTAVEAIHARVESGEITREQARTEIEALGIELPQPPGFENLTDEQRASLEAIHARVESGEITREQARTEIEALGITLPQRGGRGHRGFGG